MENALTTNLGDDFLGDLSFFLGLFFIASLSFVTHFFGQRLDQRAVPFVPFISLMVLPVALQCRFMISQKLLLYIGR